MHFGNFFHYSTVVSSIAQKWSSLQKSDKFTLKFLYKIGPRSHSFKGIVEYI
jgi:hypothetical protein